MAKIQRFGFLLTSEEKILISQLAQIEGGLSQAALVRRLIHQAALEKGLTTLYQPSPVDHEQIMERRPKRSGN